MQADKMKTYSTKFMMPVVSEIGVIHLHNVYNLFEMVAENKLSSFKVKARLHRRFLSRNSMQFLSRWRCNFYIARVNQLRFQRDFSAIYRAIKCDFRRDLQNTATLSSSFAKAQAHKFCFGLICFILLRFASISFCFVSIFCFVLF